MSTEEQLPISYDLLDAMNDADLSREVSADK